MASSSAPTAAANYVTDDELSNSSTISSPSASDTEAVKPKRRRVSEDIFRMHVEVNPEHTRFAVARWAEKCGFDIFQKPPSCATWKYSTWKAATEDTDTSSDESSSESESEDDDVIEDEKEEAAKN